MSIRLNFTVEGQTEETFVNRVLKPHLADRSVWASVRCVLTGRKRGYEYRGGMTTYQRARNDIMRWLLQDQNPDARFTTMFDLYALPNDFPGYQDSLKTPDPYERVSILEDALREDLDDWRFIPYIQLHEFEALLLSDPQKLDSQFYEYDKEIARLIKVADEFDSPEMIDDGTHTAPSKRIIAEIPEYDGRKVSAGPIVAERIGLPALRAKCQHFNDWLDKLESLSDSS